MRLGFGDLDGESTVGVHEEFTMQIEVTRGELLIGAAARPLEGRADSRRVHRNSEPAKKFFQKVAGTVNPAELLTKHSDAQAHRR